MRRKRKNLRANGVDLELEEEEKGWRILEEFRRNLERLIKELK